MLDIRAQAKPTGLDGVQQPFAFVLAEDLRTPLAVLKSAVTTAHSKRREQGTKRQNERKEILTPASVPLEIPVTDALSRLRIWLDTDQSTAPAQIRCKIAFLVLDGQSKWP